MCGNLFRFGPRQRYSRPAIPPVVHKGQEPSHVRIHHAPRNLGNLRRRRLDPLAGLGHRHGDLGEGRQRPSTPPSPPALPRKSSSPILCGPAGETPILLSAAGSDGVKVICGQGTAPAAATIAAYRDQGLDLVPGSGLLAAVVPGGLRRLDAAVARLRHHAPGRRAGTRHRLRPGGLPGGPQHLQHHRRGERSVPRRMGKPRPPSTSRAATCRRREASFATPIWPPPTGASSMRPRAATGWPRSRRPGASGPRASSPRPSTASAAKPKPWTSRASATGVY